MKSTPDNEVLVRVYPNVYLPISSVLEILKVTINITNDRRYDNSNLDTVREVTIDDGI